MSSVPRPALQPLTIPSRHAPPRAVCRWERARYSHCSFLRRVFTASCCQELGICDQKRTTSDTWLRAQPWQSAFTSIGYVYAPGPGRAWLSNICWGPDISLSFSPFSFFFLSVFCPWMPCMCRACCRAKAHRRTSRRLPRQQETWFWALPT